ncbi:MAG: hypothetical protein U1A28_02145 [Patescibacteria group bacterium]|nr:hypothetical protein [Patescibacteria group bacterium]
MAFFQKVKWNIIFTIVFYIAGVVLLFLGDDLVSYLQLPQGSPATIGFVALLIIMVTLLVQIGGLFYDLQYPEKEKALSPRTKRWQVYTPLVVACALFLIWLIGLYTRRDILFLGLMFLVSGIFQLLTRTIKTRTKNRASLF